MSAGGHAVVPCARPEEQPGDAGQRHRPVDRHPPAGAGRGAVRRAPRRPRRHRPEQRRDPRLRQQAEFRPQPVRRGDRRRELARAQRIARQAAAQPGAARHLSARLDLQAVPGAGGTHARQAPDRRAADGLSDPGLPYNFGNHSFRDDKEAAPPRHVVRHAASSIVQSCDTYYYALANDLGVDAIHDFMSPLGFGRITGIDMHGELRGTLPSTAWTRTAYKKKEAQKWYAGETISLGIGQGYNSFTMLQLAQAEAALAASGGQRFTPHLVRAIENYETRASRARSPSRRCRRWTWKPEHVAVIHNALYGVTAGGHVGALVRQRPYKLGRQDRHGAVVIEIIGQREVQRVEARRAPPRPRALRCVRAAPVAEDRAGDRRRERRLRRRRRPRRSPAASSTTCSRGST